MAKKKIDEKNKENKEKMLDLALKQIQKDYGEGAIMKLGENHKMNIKAIFSVFIIFVIAVVFGGVQRGIMF